MTSTRPAMCEGGLLIREAVGAAGWSHRLRLRCDIYRRVLTEKRSASVRYQGTNNIKRPVYYRETMLCGAVHVDQQSCVCTANNATLRPIPPAHLHCLELWQRRGCLEVTQRVVDHEANRKANRKANPSQPKAAKVLRSTKESMTR